mmetsp:Transcript_15763/g.37673  ORF Transcript_15763/g.37673 Transcript_15763/m.37673 type:complete len:225 (-) Transcript_15763:1365-2039(-)
MRIPENPKPGRVIFRGLRGCQVSRQHARPRSPPPSISPPPRTPPPPSSNPRSLSPSSPRASLRSCLPPAASLWPFQSSQRTSPCSPSPCPPPPSRPPSRAHAPCHPPAPPSLPRASPTASHTSAPHRASPDSTRAPALNERGRSRRSAAEASPSPTPAPIADPRRRLAPTRRSPLGTRSRTRPCLSARALCRRGQSTEERAGGSEREGPGRRGARQGGLGQGHP